MPGISQGYSIAAAANIDRAIANTFEDEQVRKDAQTILDLSFKAHLFEDAMLQDQIKLIWGVCSVEAIVLLFVKLFLGLTAAVLLFGVYRWILWRRRDAKRRLDLLIRSDQNYWNRIVFRVKQIVIESGNAEHALLGRRQVIRLTE